MVAWTAVSAEEFDPDQAYVFARDHWDERLGTEPTSSERGLATARLLLLSDAGHDRVVAGTAKGRQILTRARIALSDWETFGPLASQVSLALQNQLMRLTEANGYDWRAGGAVLMDDLATQNLYFSLRFRDIRSLMSRVDEDSQKTIALSAWCRKRGGSISWVPPGFVNVTEWRRLASLPQADSQAYVWLVSQVSEWMESDPAFAEALVDAYAYLAEYGEHPLPMPSAHYRAQVQLFTAVAADLDNADYQAMLQQHLAQVEETTIAVGLWVIEEGRNAIPDGLPGADTLRHVLERLSEQPIVAAETWFYYQDMLAESGVVPVLPMPTDL
jgi:hypothetical protein